MAQLGNRLYFYEIISVEDNEEELIAFAKQDNGDSHMAECQKLVNDFIDAHFQRSPVKTVDPSTIEIPDKILKDIVRYARLISTGRVEVAGDGFSNERATTPEGSRRIINSLKMFVRGSALADQRMLAGEGDLSMARHIAFSTIPENRRKLLRALLLSGETLTSTDAAAVLAISKPTALDWMKELAATALVDLQPGDSQASKPASITLAKKWLWLRESEAVIIKQPEQTP
jgi:hypothetical protein